MKEFIDKLIERLAERSAYHQKYGDSNGYTFAGYEGAIGIVNQLAGEYKAKTNADRIRAMNDDELTDFIFNIGIFTDDGEDKKYIDEDYIVHDDCTSILEWLQSESEKE